ncbi:hypothetical protein D9M70_529070 [compost metagenome]
MHGHEEIATRLALSDECADDRRAVRALKGNEIGGGDAKIHRVTRVDLDERFGEVGGEARALTGAGHRVPVVAHAAGVQGQREAATDAGRHGARNRDEAGTPIRVEEATIGKEAGLALWLPQRLRPLERRERVVGRSIDLRMGADVEIAPPVILERRKTSMLGEDF